MGKRKRWVKNTLYSPLKEYFWLGTKIIFTVSLWSHYCFWTLFHLSLTGSSGPLSSLILCTSVNHTSCCQDDHPESPVYVGLGLCIAVHLKNWASASVLPQCSPSFFCPLMGMWLSILLSYQMLALLLDFSSCHCTHWIFGTTETHVPLLQNNVCIKANKTETSRLLHLTLNLLVWQIIFVLI